MATRQCTETVGEIAHAGAVAGWRPRVQERLQGLEVAVRGGLEDPVAVTATAVAEGQAVSVAGESSLHRKFTRRRGCTGCVVYRQTSHRYLRAAHGLGSAARSEALGTSIKSQVAAAE